MSTRGFSMMLLCYKAPSWSVLSALRVRMRLLTRVVYFLALRGMLLLLLYR